MSCTLCHHALINHLDTGCIVCNCGRNWVLDNYETPGGKP